VELFARLNIQQLTNVYCSTLLLKMLVLLQTSNELFINLKGTNEIFSYLRVRRKLPVTVNSLEPCMI